MAEAGKKDSFINQQEYVEPSEYFDCTGCPTAIYKKRLPIRQKIGGAVSKIMGKKSKDVNIQSAVKKLEKKKKCPIVKVSRNK